MISFSLLLLLHAAQFLVESAPPFLTPEGCAVNQAAQPAEELAAPLLAGQLAIFENPHRVDRFFSFRSTNSRTIFFGDCVIRRIFLLRIKTPSSVFVCGRVSVCGHRSLCVRVYVCSYWCLYGCVQMVLLMFRMFKITASSRLMRSMSTVDAAPRRLAPGCLPSCTRGLAARARGVCCTIAHFCVCPELNCAKDSVMERQDRGRGSSGRGS